MDSGFSIFIGLIVAIIIILFGVLFFDTLHHEECSKVPGYASWGWYFWGSCKFYQQTYEHDINKVVHPDFKPSAGLANCSGMDDALNPALRGVCNG